MVDLVRNTIPTSLLHDAGAQAVMSFHDEFQLF